MSQERERGSLSQAARRPAEPVRSIPAAAGETPGSYEPGQGTTVEQDGRSARVPVIELDSRSCSALLGLCDECRYQVSGTYGQVLKQLCRHLYRHADSLARSPAAYRARLHARRRRDATS